MAQDNTKLCDFSNTNNNDFISTPIAPITDAKSCEINAALLNLVMKDQFSGLPSEDAATHLNNFIDLCDMQKKKYVHNDVVKLKLFPFSLRDRAKAWFSSLPKNSIDFIRFSIGKRSNRSSNKSLLLVLVKSHNLLLS